MSYKFSINPITNPVPLSRYYHMTMVPEVGWIRIIAFDWTDWIRLKTALGSYIAL
jgi:hypothetical protein